MMQNGYQQRFLWIVLCLGFCASMADAQNHVLDLDGKGDYVEITNNKGLNAINSQVTIEAWIKPTRFPNQWMPLIYKGDGHTPGGSNRSYTLWLNSSGFIHFTFTSAPGQGERFIESPPGLIALSRWYHVAGVIDAKRMRLFLNGTEVANAPFGTAIHQSALPLRIGSSHEEEVSVHSPFAGQLDEVRIWNVARTEAQIQETILTPLRGTEPGLVGYWTFEGQAEKVIDATGNGHDGRFVDGQRLHQRRPDQGIELHR
jgi:hypothetical protein